MELLALFTIREKLALLIAVITGCLVIVLENLSVNISELFLLLFVVLPAGWLVATDKERIKRIENEEGRREFSQN